LKRDRWMSVIVKIIKKSVIKITMKETIIKGGIRVTLLFLLCFASIGYAQENGLTTPFGGTEGIFRSGIFIVAEGEVNASNSHEEMLDEGRFAFNYSIDASADKGKTMIAHSVSSIPLLWQDDRLIRTHSVLGHDALGTGGSLKGSESMGAAGCSENAGIGMSAGVIFDLAEGTIVTSSRTENARYKSEYLVMAYGEGAVEAFSSGESMSFVGDGEGGYVNTSSVNYSQSAMAEGKISSFSQESSMSPSGFGCSIW
jgi:hypothetical protein